LNILTKIFIVAQLVVILVACPVFITQAVVPANYRIAYERQVQQTRLNVQDARVANLSLERSQRELETTRAQAEKARITAETEVDTLQSDFKSLQSKNNMLLGQMETINAKIGKLQAAAELDIKLRTDMQKDLKTARKTIVDCKSQNGELELALSKAVARAQRQEKVNQVLQEQIAQQKSEIARYIKERETVGKGIPGGIGKISTPTVTIKGEVTGEITAVGPNDTASINIGSAKGIKKNMKLYIYRGGNFVGYLRVGMVDASQAAGVVVDKRLDVMRGDKVTNRLKY